MKMIQLIAVVLVIVSVFALTYGGFTYTKDTLELTPGLLRLTLDGQQQVQIPVWASSGGILIGCILLILGRSGHRNPSDSR